LYGLASPLADHDARMTMIAYVFLRHRRLAAPRNIEDRRKASINHEPAKNRLCSDARIAIGRVAAGVAAANR
jgi:hypothetical protein